MADFYGCLESTSFRVKDREAFLSDKDTQWLQSHAKNEGFFDEDKDGYFSFGWYGQYPSTVLTGYDLDQQDSDKELDICELVARHILPGDVAQIGISGNEKLRYIGGDIFWVTSKGVASFAGVTEWSDKLTEERLAQFAQEFAGKVTDVLA